MGKGTGAFLFEEPVPDRDPDDPHNMAFPCHPKHAQEAFPVPKEPWVPPAGMTSDDTDGVVYYPGVHPLHTPLPPVVWENYYKAQALKGEPPPKKGHDHAPGHGINPQARVTCPECAATYRVRPHIFYDPWTAVLEWAATDRWGSRVYPVPSRLLLGRDTPLWSDLTVIETPEDPRPFVVHPTDYLFGSATTGDLALHEYAYVLSHLKTQAKGSSELKKRPVRLISMALPVTVNGHVAARAGDVLLSMSWWGLPSGNAVQAYCPRFGRGVVLHHSFAVVPRPIGKE